MSIFQGLPGDYTKTTIEHRYEQDQEKLGPVLTEVLSSTWTDENGGSHLVRVVGCYYGSLIEIDGDCWEPVDGSSVARFS